MPQLQLLKTSITVFFSLPSCRSPVWPLVSFLAKFSTPEPVTPHRRPRSSVTLRTPAPDSSAGWRYGLRTGSVWRSCGAAERLLLTATRFLSHVGPAPGFYFFSYPPHWDCSLRPLYPPRRGPENFLQRKSGEIREFTIGSRAR